MQDMLPQASGSPHPVWVGPDPPLATVETVSYLAGHEANPQGVADLSAGQLGSCLIIVRQNGGCLTLTAAHPTDQCDRCGSWRAASH